ncbi:hypothetical protein UFOVP647_38 [uncultured Caudovirales phage]|uniref:Uncharacterized protein n=1 Tax=uncultured Caudovirales phage TaxID=2100421 RepID=A0A6J5N7Y9_9CAUD|nr:hypothetical protein UFOVP647_38 [uncultured Caudovirales phage]
MLGGCKMNQLKECWKLPGNEMLSWALEWELTTGNTHHGLGDITKGCNPVPGEACPACGEEWPLIWDSKIIYDR